MSRPEDDLALQRGGVGERVEHDGRAEIGEQVHLLAQPQQAAFPAAPRRAGSPHFRAADGAEQHRVGGDRIGQRLVGQRQAVRVDGRASHQPFPDVEGDMAAPVHPVHHAADLPHHLRTDAVAGENEQLLVGRHVRPLFLRCAEHSARAPAPEAPGVSVP